MDIKHTFCLHDCKSEPRQKTIRDLEISNFDVDEMDEILDKISQKLFEIDAILTALNKNMFGQHRF